MNDIFTLRKDLVSICQGDLNSSIPLDFFLKNLDIEIGEPIPLNHSLIMSRLKETKYD